MPKFEIKVSERQQEWSRDNEALQSTQSVIVDTPGYDKTQVVQSDVQDTPGYGGDAGQLAPLSD